MRTLMVDRLARNDLERFDQLFRLGAAVGFDDSDHDVVSRLLAAKTVGEHFIGLTNARSRAQEDLQPSPPFPHGLAQEGVGGRSFGFA